MCYWNFTSSPRLLLCPFKCLLYTITGSFQWFHFFSNYCDEAFRCWEASTSAIFAVFFFVSQKVDSSFFQMEKVGHKYEFRKMLVFRGLKYKTSMFGFFNALLYPFTVIVFVLCVLLFKTINKVLSTESNYKAEWRIFSFLFLFCLVTSCAVYPRNIGQNGHFNGIQNKNRPQQPTRNSLVSKQLWSNFDGIFLSILFGNIFRELFSLFYK